MSTISREGHGRLEGILIGKLVEREAAAFSDFNCACQRFGIAAEKTPHFFRRFQIAIDVALAPEASLVDGAIVPDASDGH